jgi:hypothetical protein
MRPTVCVFDISELQFRQEVATGGTICAERTAFVKAVVRPHLFVRHELFAQLDHPEQSDGTQTFRGLAVVTYVRVPFLMPRNRSP